MKKLARKAKLPAFVRSKWFFIALAVFLAALVGLYAWWSISSWNSYQTRYTALRTVTEQQLGKAIDMKIETTEQRKEKLTALKNVAETLPTPSGDICQVGFATAWQGFIEDLKKKKEECNKGQAVLITLRSSLDKVVVHLESDRTLATLLSAAPVGGEIPEADWTKQRDAWSGVAVTVRELQSDNDFAPVKQVAIDRMGGMVAAWEEVLAAHQAKDKARYIKAASTLAQAFDNLAAISQASTGELQKRVKDLESAYQCMKEL